MAVKYEYCVFLIAKSKKYLGQYKGRWLEGLTLSEAKDYLVTARNLRPNVKWVIGRREIHTYVVCYDNGKPIEEGK